MTCALTHLSTHTSPKFLGVVTHDHGRWSRVKVSLVIEIEGGEGG